MSSPLDDGSRINSLVEGPNTLKGLHMPPSRFPLHQPGERLFRLPPRQNDPRGIENYTLSLGGFSSVRVGHVPFDCETSNIAYALDYQICPTKQNKSECTTSCSGGQTQPTLSFKTGAQVMEIGRLRGLPSHVYHLCKMEQDTASDFLVSSVSKDWTFVFEEGEMCNAINGYLDTISEMTRALDYPADSDLASFEPFTSQLLPPSSVDRIQPLDLADFEPLDTPAHCANGSDCASSQHPAELKPRDAQTRFVRSIGSCLSLNMTDLEPPYINTAELEGCDDSPMTAVLQDFNDAAKPNLRDRTDTSTVESEVPAKCAGQEGEQESKFPCPYCSACFSKSHNRSRHVSACHRGLREFSCDICNAKFTQPGNMKRHKRTVHFGQKAFRCDICGVGLASRINLVKHMRARHPNVERGHEAEL